MLFEAGFTSPGGAPGLGVASSDEPERVEAGSIGAPIAANGSGSYRVLPVPGGKRDLRLEDSAVR